MIVIPITDPRLLWVPHVQMEVKRAGLVPLSPYIVMISHQLAHSPLQTLYVFFSAVLIRSGLNCGPHVLDTALTVGGGTPMYGQYS